MSYGQTPEVPTFMGGKFTSFSKQINPNQMLVVPNNMDIEYLRFSKVLPRVNNHYSGVTSNYLYVYLDPFKPAGTISDYHYKVPGGMFGTTDLFFGYEPIYIGKGVSSTGHRMNQHVADFLNMDEDSLNGQKIKNPVKMNKFQEISKHFSKASEDPYLVLPTNWNEYKKDWVCILFTFPDRMSLEVAERILIQTIGSVGGLRKGPLTNVSLTR